MDIQAERQVELIVVFTFGFRRSKEHATREDFPTEFRPGADSEAQVHADLLILEVYEIRRVRTRHLQRWPRFNIDGQRRRIARRAP